jgi:hypothetical protein
MDQESDLITEVPAEFIQQFRAEIEGTLPMEKAQVELRQLRNKRVMDAAGSVMIEGLGQKIAQIDARAFFRSFHASGDKDPAGDWLHDLIMDDPTVRCPGYRPRRRKGDLRHSKTFINGRPV